MGIVPILPTLAAGIGIPTFSAWLSGERLKDESTLRKIAIGSVVGIALTGLAFMYGTPETPAAAAVKSYPAGTPTWKIASEKGVAMSEQGLSLYTGVPLPSKSSLNSFPEQPNGWYTEGYPTTGKTKGYMSGSIIFVD